MTSRARSGLVLLAVAVLAALAGAPAHASEASRPHVVEKAISAGEAIRIANRTPEVRNQKRRHPDLRADNISFFKLSGDWSISYLSGDVRLADITVDGRTGKVLEAWQGVQAGWIMARGHDGYFGKRFEAWYIWLPLCLLFVAPFFDPRRPFRLLHLDLLVLVGGFGASHFFFNEGEIGTSVPLVYPVLAYLLVRMLVAGFRPRQTGQRLVPFAPAAFFVVAIVLLTGFRIGVELEEGRVGDVGYANAVGAWRIDHGEPLYVDSGRNDVHFDTYGPASYLSYVPFVKALPPSEKQTTTSGDFELASARAAAIAFDLLTILGLFLLGRRLRRGREGRLLGLALAYGWVAFPYTLFPLMTNTNDSLIAMLLVFALLAVASVPARAALTGLAAAAKFAPVLLAPLFATGRGEHRARSWPWYGLMFVSIVAAVTLPFIPAKGGFGTFWSQTIGFQLDRESPFSIWGQNPSLDWLLTVVKAAAVMLAVAVAFVPRRRTTAQVAALGAAVLIATQATAIHWFYLYIVWFAPFALVALFAEHETGRKREGHLEPHTIEIAPARHEPDRELAGVA